MADSEAEPQKLNLSRAGSYRDSLRYYTDTFPPSLSLSPPASSIYCLYPFTRPRLTHLSRIITAVILRLELTGVMTEAATLIFLITPPHLLRHLQHLASKNGRGGRGRPSALLLKQAATRAAAAAALQWSLQPVCSRLRQKRYRYG